MCALEISQNTHLELFSDPEKSNLIQVIAVIINHIELISFEYEWKGN